jgi:hypothetical protein
MARHRGCSLVIVAVALVPIGVVLEGACTSSPKDCRVACPPGTTIDETTCGCTQTGPVCDSGPPEVQDGGPVLSTCCSAYVIQSTTRTTPTGACSGSQPCFTAVRQVCPGSSNTDESLVDEYSCTCNGANWRCSLITKGAGVCAPVDAGGE